jgi:hypothetical protein
MYTIINNFNGHTAQSYALGKKAFIEEHQNTVFDVEKVWEQVEKDFKAQEKAGKKASKEDKTEE